jgi:predicted DNA-binding transcriptional regulator AlpA
MNNNERKYLSAREVEAAYGIAEKTLANWRSQGRGPAYHKLGGKVRYKVGDLEEWAKKSRVLTIDCRV